MRPALLLLALCSVRAAVYQSSSKEAADIARIVKSAHAPQPPFTLAACVVFKNERPYLAEWLWYHILVGWEHFYMYDNGSDDNSTEALQPFVELGYVTYNWWPTRPPFPNGQERMLRHCFNATNEPVRFSKWLSDHDIDEFPVFTGVSPTVGQARRLEPFTSHHMLARYAAEGVGALTLDRMNFDMSGRVVPNYKDPNAFGIVIQDYTSYNVESLGWTIAGKVIIRLEAFPSCPEQHRALNVTDTLDDEGWLSCTRAEYKRVGYASTGRRYFSDCCMYPSHDTIVKPGYRNIMPNGEQWYPSTLWGVQEPLVIFHYEKRSWEECVAKLDPNYNSGWRAKVGISLCEIAMEGKPGYIPEQHQKTNKLAASLYSDVLRHLLF